MRYISNYSSAAAHIAALHPFNGSSMYGYNGTTGTGRLPDNWAHQYAALRDEIVYTVASWSTPIAWLTRAGVWYFPAYSYSGYTSRHQSLTRAGIWAWFDANGIVMNDPANFRTADMYCTLGEMYERWNRGDMAPTQRRLDLVTVRGIKNGDWLQFEIDLEDPKRYRMVYGIDSTRNGDGTRTFYAMTMREGTAHYARIGSSNDRTARLR